MRDAFNFLVHLRLHYQLFILSGPYLLGGVYAAPAEWPRFIGQFLVVQLLLFGGATAFNSFWDRDTGPIGGLRRPPPMQSWMRSAAIGLQVLGLLLAAPVGGVYPLLYVASMLLFWLYSSPLARWKGNPHLSLVAVGVSTGLNPCLMAYLAAGGSGLNRLPVLAAVGAALLLVSMYPVSQVFQLEEDRRRGDVTFAAAYGLKGVRVLFGICYAVGLGVVAWTLLQVGETLGIVFSALGGAGGLVTGWRLWHLEGKPGEYDEVMRLKYFTSFVFVSFIVVVLALEGLWDHGTIGSRDSRTIGP